MQLSPRYTGDPVLTLDGTPAAIARPTVRQRRRLVDVLTSFDADQWAHPSRCDGWSNRDVIVHLDSTNTFWTLSIAAGLRGEPTQFLTTFDPVASPAQLVAGSQDLSNDEVLRRFVASTEQFVQLLTALDEDHWTERAEAPPGHIHIGAVAHHALWDSWVHERDVLLPLGIAPDEEADEITACLRYAAALGPALAVTRGTVRTGTLSVSTTAPEVCVVVEIGDRVVVRDETPEGTASADADLELTGDAVELLEALSIRRPFGQAVPAESAWMLRGLSETFDG